MERAARLIRQNPNIRAQEAAEALGYSEPKALRYHLNKEGFRNFSDFRGRVLSGHYQPPPPSAQEAVAPWPEVDDGLPVAVRISAAGEPHFDDATARALPSAQPPRLFGYRWIGAAYDAYLRPGALLVIRRDARAEAGELVLGTEPLEGLGLWRRYPLAAGILLVDPGNPHHHVLPPESARWHVMGRVVEVRALP